MFRLLESHGALSTDQIKFLLFPSTCLRIVQRRLKKLTESGRIRRERISIDEPYYYYATKKPGQLEHVLGVSWIYTWVRLSLNDSISLHNFDREVTYKTLRPDAFIGVKGTWSNLFTFFFAEFDIIESGHDFGEKVKRYCEYFSSGAYLNQWWVPLAKRFPIIRVVTTGNVKKLGERIARANTHNLEFQVFSLKQVKEECINGTGSSRSLRA
ncbi:hypothetical protein [Desulfosporosinus sp. OT]|uniref:hypothetical protein n=1 Tax=Desulfosporosinus sp. OT TaxID=913865 RepID=UPI00058C8450|nr:hypothetical protein [Desulfosporosinus sp. OT]